MNRLWVRLTLAFALVVLVTVGTIAILADLTAGNAFRRYLSYSEVSRYQVLGDLLAKHYQANGSWLGVDVLLDRERVVPGPLPRLWDERRPGAMRRAGALQIVLADGGMQVVYDSQGGRLGRKLTRDERAAAQEIVVEAEVVGHLVIALPVRRDALGPLEQAFVIRLRWLLVTGGLLACGLGVLLGLALSRSLAAPLQRLADASRAVAGRDFARRVEVGGSAEMAEVAQAFNEMAAALEQSEQQRQNLVADVAHELRAPLSVVQGNLRAILDDVCSLDKGEIAKIYDETRLLSRLVDDLRELALADAGQLSLNLVPTDAVRVIRSTSENLALASEAQDVTLDVDIPDEMPRAQVDPDRLAQILRNLLVNALRHTPPGGRVTVTAEEAGGYLQISVVDSGEGIAARDLPHVFERFWRADRSRSRDDRLARRTGLGLSVAQSLVEAQGGRIWAESIPGEGTAFRFTLPLAAGVAAEDAG